MCGFPCREFWPLMRVYDMKRMHLFTFMATVGVSLIGTLASMGMFVFLYARIQDAYSDLEDIAGEISAREDARKNARALAVVLAEKQDDVNRVRSFFVDRNRPVAFIEALERLAAETNVGLEISIDEGNARTDLFVFRLSVDGEAPRVRAYLGLLETMPYAVRVAAFQYHIGEAEKSGNNANGSLSVLLEVEART